MEFAATSQNVFARLASNPRRAVLALLTLWLLSVLIFLSAVWPIVYGAYDGFRNIPRAYMLVCRQFGATFSVRVVMFSQRSSK